MVLKYLTAISVALWAVGTATICPPSEGSVNSEINRLFNKTSCIASVAVVANPSSVSASPSSSSSTSTSLPQISPTNEVNKSGIIGGVIGGVVGVILLSLAIWFVCIYKSRRKQKRSKGDSVSAATLLANRPQTRSRQSESDGLLFARPYDYMYQPITQTAFPNVTIPYPNISSIISPLSGTTVGAGYTPVFPPLSGATVGAGYTSVFLGHPTTFPVPAAEVNANNISANCEMVYDMRPLPLRVRPTHGLHELGSGKSYCEQPAPVPVPVPSPVRPTYELHELGNGKSYSTPHQTAEEEVERAYAYVKLRPFSWEIQSDWNSSESVLWLSRGKGKERELERAGDACDG